MGSSATEFVGDRLGVSVKVPSYTLSTIAKRTGLSKVDFIKCDVEGAEAVILEDSAFFDRYRPRTVAQVHRVGGELTTDRAFSVKSKAYTKYSMLLRHSSGLKAGSKRRMM